MVTRISDWFNVNEKFNKSCCLIGKFVIFCVHPFELIGVGEIGGNGNHSPIFRSTSTPITREINQMLKIYKIAKRMRAKPSPLTSQSPPPPLPLHQSQQEIRTKSTATVQCKNVINHLLLVQAVFSFLYSFVINNVKNGCKWKGRNVINSRVCIYVLYICI